MMEGIVVVSVFFKMDRSRGAVVILLFSEGREALMESLPDESDFDNPQWGWIRNLGSSVGLFVIVGLDGFMVCAGAFNICMFSRVLVAAAMGGGSLS
jgi:hypothetical protein